jgi:hypothetical protein
MMKAVRWCTIIVFMLCKTEAALPTGFEDELYCPLGMCLVPVHHPRGWSGPRNRFFKCVSAGLSLPQSIQPIGWGILKGEEVRTKLMREGWGVAKACLDKRDSQGVLGQKEVCYFDLLKQAISCLF